MKKTMNLTYKKRARKNNGCIQTVAFISKISPSPATFCDASVKVDNLGRSISVRVALWDLQSCDFWIEELSNLSGMCKRTAVDAAEAVAIQKAHYLIPGNKIFSDSQNAIRLCSREFGIHAEWIPRELNGIVNILAKKNSPGRGYVAFNNPSPTRGWIDLVYN